MEENIIFLPTLMTDIKGKRENDYKNKNVDQHN